LEDGSLTDARGRKVDFSNTIVILTSNVGAEAMQREVSLGFHSTGSRDDKRLENEHQANTELAENALKKIMRPELINRFDAFVTFRALTRHEVGKIFAILIDDLNKRLSSKGIHLVVNPTAKRLIIQKGYSEKYGARPLRRAIQDELEHTIADGILSGAYEKGTVLTAKAHKGKITLHVTAEK
jgi:ATP-dependent Clp protease ATP-binding subunit ClpC